MSYVFIISQSLSMYQKSECGLISSSGHVSFARWNCSLISRLKLVQIHLKVHSPHMIVERIQLLKFTDGLLARGQSQGASPQGGSQCGTDFQQQEQEKANKWPREDYNSKSLTLD